MNSLDAVNDSEDSADENSDENEDTLRSLLNKQATIKLIARLRSRGVAVTTLL